MKKWLSQTLFFFIFLATKDFVAHSKVKKATDKTVFENIFYRLEIRELPAGTTLKGTSSGKRFIQLTGYSAIEILQIVGTNRIKIENKPQSSLKKYALRIENKVSDGVQPEERLFELLAKTLKFKYKILKEERKVCRLVIASPIQLKEHQIRPSEKDYGVKSKIEHGVLYCYDCTLEDLKNVIQPNFECHFENSPNDQKFSASIELSRLEMNLKDRGIIINSYVRNVEIFKINFR
ncbi:MAG: hypothetical protein ACK4GN_13645 [Runella sp.]